MNKYKILCIILFIALVSSLFLSLTHENRTSYPFLEDIHENSPPKWDPNTNTYTINDTITFQDDCKELLIGMSYPNDDNMESSHTISYEAGYNTKDEKVNIYKKIQLDRKPLNHSYVLNKLFFI